MGRVSRGRGWWAIALLTALGVSSSAVSCRRAHKSGAPAPSASVQAGAPPSVNDAGTAPAPHPPATLLGSAIARSPDGQHLYIADEDRALLQVLRVPVVGPPLPGLKLPGPPAQVVAFSDRVLVTIRHPALLWLGRAEGDRVVEVGRVSLPDDAWGLTVLPDSKSALVSSAWSRQVSLVELDGARVRWSVPVAREPRGIVIAGGRAYVTHLVGPDLTRVEQLEGPPRVSRVVLPAAPLRTPPGQVLAASLGYSAALSADQDRLFVARHALGALGKNAWFGAATVDVLLLSGTEEPLAPRRRENLAATRSELAETLISGGDTKIPGASLTPFTQPRAMVLRRSTNTLLVAGEGDDRVAELDALALDPTLALVRHYQVGVEYHPSVHVPKHGAAPAGLALSEDERTLWVYCRATDDVAEIHLSEPGATVPAGEQPAPTFSQLAVDPLGPGGATGRKLFYNSTDHLMSSGLACAGCHPEGRDDGNTWHEGSFQTEDGLTTNFVGNAANIPPEAQVQGVARRTPQLAGRVRAEGPYGWHAESNTLRERISKGFGLHRWGAIPVHTDAELELRANALADFLRRGLVPPAKLERELNADEQRGREIFSSKETDCTSCHVPNTEFTTRLPFPLPALAKRPGFDDDPNASFKIPSLAYLNGRAPYLHDGSAQSLAELLEKNADRMGHTKQLSALDRSRLLAYLETL